MGRMNCMRRSRRIHGNNIVSLLNGIAFIVPGFLKLMKIKGFLLCNNLAFKRNA